MECGTKIEHRIDSDLLALNQEATRMIPTMFTGSRIDLDNLGLPTECSQVWLAYLAAEAYGNADAALILLTHNRDRQARILERQLYECVKRAEYYARNPDEARLEFLAWPWRDKKLYDDLQHPNDSPRYNSIKLAIKNITNKYPEVERYATEHQYRERSFHNMVVEPTNPQSAKDYAFHYRRLSQTPHGSVSGMEDVLEFRKDGVLGIKFDSRLDDPNVAIEAMTSQLIHLLDLLDQVYQKSKWQNEIQPLDTRLNEIMARLHPDEANHLATGLSTGQSTTKPE